MLIIRKGAVLVPCLASVALLRCTIRVSSAGLRTRVV